MVGRRFVLPFALVITFVLLTACSGSGADAPQATTEPTATTVAPSPTATPTTRGETAPSGGDTEAPDGQRMLGYIRQLAESIGPRVAGAASERSAADYIAEQLRGFGYEVDLQDFTVADEGGRDSLLTVNGSRTPVPSVPFQGSAAGKVSGRIVAVPGLGEPGDFPADVRGAIALIERGELLFREKVANAKAAGALGVIISNNEPGLYYGSLGTEVELPTLAISQSEGNKLRNQIAAGPVSGELGVDTLARSTSYNVVAKPPGQECETVSGGHYDSVPQAPGANDNASGTATVIELAGILARAGKMGSNCFVLFGAEEVGLVGSRAYVGSLDAAARDRLKAMLNFDMVGVGDDSWQLIGSPELQTKAQTLANTLGIPVVRSNLAGTGAGSDHSSFIDVGIPALFLHRTNDSAWHQPNDRPDRIRTDLLETAARLGLALLDDINSNS